MEKEQDNWDNFTGKKWLNADEVKEDFGFVIKAFDVSDDDRPLLTLERENETTYFELNVTNSVKAKKFVNKPSELIGKVIYFSKVKVISPKTKQEVDSLRIANIA